MKTLNVARRYAGRAAGAFAITAATTGAAFADASAATASLTSVSGDISTIGWAVLGVLIVAAGFKYMRRAI